ncbi:MAG: DUF4261 domain-containing protein [Myxococcota bacterium]
MKGFHTQGLVVLFREAPRPDALDAALAPFRAVPKPVEEPTWIAGDHDGFAIAAPRGGLATVHVLARAWPDSMGDPKTDGVLYGAWMTGFFGPFAYPMGLARAVRHAYGWEGAAEAVTKHCAFVRVLVTYVAGAKPDAPVLPEGYDARAELDFATAIAAAIAAIPGALAYFDPSGEVLLPPEELGPRLADGLGQARPAIDAWTNVRIGRVDEAPPWILMDTVGLAQLDRDDLEACFPGDRVEPDEVARFLRNVSLYVVERGDVIKDGHTLDGPNGRWRAWRTEQGLMDPPRPTLRMFPEVAGTAPALLRKGTGAEAKGFWSRFFG